MSYVIAGRAIKNEYLAIGTIASAIGATLAFTGGSSDAPAQKGAAVPVKEDKSIAADSKEELDFIQQFVAEAEKEDKAGH